MRIDCYFGVGTLTFVSEQIAAFNLLADGTCERAKREQNQLATTNARCTDSLLSNSFRGMKSHLVCDGRANR